MQYQGITLNHQLSPWNQKWPIAYKRHACRKSWELSSSSPRWWVQLCLTKETVHSEKSKTNANCGSSAFADLVKTSYMSEKMSYSISEKYALRRLKTVSSTFQDVDFDRSLLPLFTVFPNYGQVKSKSPGSNNKWMAWCKTDLSDFFRVNFFHSKVPKFLQVLFNLVVKHSRVNFYFLDWFALCLSFPHRNISPTHHLS